MRKPAIICLMVVASLLSACGPSDPGKGTADKTRITIAQFGHVFLYLPLYVARSKGYFAEQNLDVTLVDTGGDDKTFAAVASGSAQFGVADPTFTAIAREQGKGGKVIASLVNGVPFWGVTYRKDIGPIASPTGLAGYRIATYPSPSTNYAVIANTLREEKVQNATIVQGAFGALLAMLKAQDADIAMELEPVASIAVNDGAAVVYSSTQRLSDFAFTGITTTEELVARNPAQAQAVVNSIAKAIRFIRTDFDGALAVAATEFPDVPKDVLRSALKRLLDDKVIPESVVLSEAAWKNATDVRRSVGDIKGTALFADNVDMQFAARVQK